MLVLSRQKNEAIIIGDDIEVIVVDIRGDRVRLGINAPHNVPVHRKEVYEAIKRENIEASRAAAADLSKLGTLLGGAAPSGEKEREKKTGGESKGA